MEWAQRYATNRTNGHRTLAVLKFTERFMKAEVSLKFLVSVIINGAPYMTSYSINRLLRWTAIGHVLYGCC